MKGGKKMIKNFKILGTIAFILTTFLAFFPLVSAEDIYKKNDKIDIKESCFNNGTYCSASASCNITVYKPSSVVVYSNRLMTNNITYHNFTLINNSDTNETGLYRYFITCNDGSLKNFATFEFEVTDTGGEEPSEILKLAFYIGFFVILGGFLITMFRNLEHLIKLDYDMVDLIWSVSIFLLFFGFIVLQVKVLNEEVITNINSMLFPITAWTHMIVPFFIFLLSFFNTKYKEMLRLRYGEAV